MAITNNRCSGLVLVLRDILLSQVNTFSAYLKDEKMTPFLTLQLLLGFKVLNSALGW